jgi:hypothetical protein
MSRQLKAGMNYTHGESSLSYIKKYEGNIEPRPTPLTIKTGGDRMFSDSVL